MRPLDMILASTADVNRLRADVERVAESSRIMRVDCWKYLRSKGPGWMKIVADDEIRKINKSVNDLFDRLASL